MGEHEIKNTLRAKIMHDADDGGFVFRRAAPEDAETVFGILERAKAALKAAGVDQWQDGYPDMAAVLSDIAENRAYLLELDDQAAGTAAMLFEPDPAYAEPVSGAWLNDEPYAVLHRVAVAEGFKGRGAAGVIFAWAEKMCRAAGLFNLRIDTHPQNAAMLRALKKHSFIRCGAVFLSPERVPRSYRLVFHKILH